MRRSNCLLRKQGIDLEEEAFIAFAREHFDAAFYWNINNDAAQTDTDPLEHWFQHGISEGRQISRAIVLRYGKAAKRSTNRNWKHYRWRKQDVAAQLINPIPPEIMSQIANQAQHDPSVLPANMTIASLGAREGNAQIDVAGLQRGALSGMEFSVIVPSLARSEEQEFTADLVAALSSRTPRSIQTIVTDQESVDSYKTPIPEPLRATKILFWQDFLIHSPAVLGLAQLIRILRPRVTIIANSSQGYEMVKCFGRTLSKCTKLYCVYTDKGRGSEFTSHFTHWTLPFATAVTDSAALADKIRGKCDDRLGPSVVVLPAQMTSSDQAQTQHSCDAFTNAVAALFE
jgi:hypothetical protein